MSTNYLSHDAPITCNQANAAWITASTTTFEQQLNTGKDRSQRIRGNRMFAISFDMNTATLKAEYDEPYNQAYNEIALELEKFSFSKVHGSFFVSDEATDAMVNAWDAVDHLASIPWFKKSVRDIHVFEVRNWSNVTERVKA